jgi:GT2 family glycosyltransferase
MRDIGVGGVVACYGDKKMIITDGGSLRFYTSGLMWGVNTNKNINRIEQNIYGVDEVANAFMIPRNVFEDVGGFDEENFPIDMDEADICKRIKDMGYRIVMNPTTVCYHDSQTYSNIPDFRRPMNGYFMGRNKVLYQKKHLKKMQYVIYILIFMPMTVFGYFLCLSYRRKFKMFSYFLKGTIDGILGVYENQFQKK